MVCCANAVGALLMAPPLTQENSYSTGQSSLLSFQIHAPGLTCLSGSASLTHLHLPSCICVCRASNMNLYRITTSCGSKRLISLRYGGWKRSDLHGQLYFLQRAIFQPNWQPVMWFLCSPASSTKLMCCGAHSFLTEQLIQQHFDPFSLLSRSCHRSWKHLDSNP